MVKIQTLFLTFSLILWGSPTIAWHTDITAPATTDSQNVDVLKYASTISTLENQSEAHQLRPAFAPSLCIKLRQAQQGYGEHSWYNKLYRKTHYLMTRGIKRKVPQRLAKIAFLAFVSLRIALFQTAPEGSPQKLHGYNHGISAACIAAVAALLYLYKDEIGITHQWTKKTTDHLQKKLYALHHFLLNDGQ